MMNKSKTLGDQNVFLKLEWSPIRRPPKLIKKKNDNDVHNYHRNLSPLLNTNGNRGIHLFLFANFMGATL